MVEELGFAASGDGEHDFLTIEKTGANTEWLARQLARHAGVAINDVGFCGQKDRQAVTTQHFTVRRPGRAGTDWAAFAADGVRLLDWRRHHRKLRRGAHAANRFRIIARADGFGEHAAPLAARWALVAAAGVPNYFGEQRFGRDGGNLDLARAVLDGRRVRREQRSIAISAARSYLFNCILAERIRDGSWNRLLQGERVNLDGSGSVFRADEVSAELAERCAAFDLHPTASLWGDGAPLAAGAAALRERAAIAGEEALSRGLERARIEAGSRALRVRPRDTAFSCDADTGSFSFSLPAGSFATSVLREVISAPLRSTYRAPVPPCTARVETKARTESQCRSQRFTFGFRTAPRSPEPSPLPCTTLTHRQPRRVASSRNSASLYCASDVVMPCRSISPCTA